MGIMTESCSPESYIAESSTFQSHAIVSRKNPSCCPIFSDALIVGILPGMAIADIVKEQDVFAPEMGTPC